MQIPTCLLKLPRLNRNIFLNQKLFNCYLPFLIIAGVISEVPIVAVVVGTPETSEVTLGNNPFSWRKLGDKMLSAEMKH